MLRNIDSLFCGPNSREQYGDRKTKRQVFSECYNKKTILMRANSPTTLRLAEAAHIKALIPRGLNAPSEQPAISGQMSLHKEAIRDKKGACQKRSCFQTISTSNK
jgi:hypothetical protein